MRPLSASRVLVTLSALVSACTSPGPATPDSPVARPENVPAASPAAPEPAAVKPSAVKPPQAEPPPPEVLHGRPAALDGIDEYDEGEQPPPRIPKGIVPAELAGELMEIEHPFPSPLAEPDDCIAKQSDQDCFWDVPTIVGFSRARGEVAFFYVPRVHADAKTPPELLGERVRLEDGKSLELKHFGPIIPVSGPERTQNDKLRGEAREWVHALQQDGFAAGHDLKAWGGAVRDGGAIAFPLAVLEAPMTNWMIYAPVPSGDTLTLKLIAPGNKKAFTIATMPVKTGERCVEPSDTGACKQHVRFDTVTFGSVELDPSHTHLVALYSASSLSQEDEGENGWRVFKLPPAVKKALPKR